MVDEIIDDEEETPPGEPETPAVPSDGKPGEGEPPKDEPKVPLSRLREERQKSVKLEKELEQLRQIQSGTKPSSPEDDKGRADEKARIRQALGEIQEEEAKEVETAEREFNTELADLKLADPTLDEQALIKVMEKFEIFNIDKAYQLYRELGKGKPNEPPKPKSPSAPRTSDETPKEPAEVRGKTMMDLRQEVKREFGV